MYECLLISLFNILVNQKRGISVKEKQTAQPGNIRESYSRQNTQIHEPKKKNVLYANEGTIDYNQQCHLLHLRNKQYKQFPQKKRKKRKEKKKKKKSANEKGKEKEKEKKGRGKDKERKRE